VNAFEAEVHYLTAALGEIASVYYYAAFVLVAVYQLIYFH